MGLRRLLEGALGDTAVRGRGRAGARGPCPGTRGRPIRAACSNALGSSRSATRTRACAQGTAWEARERAELRLAQAEAQLKSLGWLGRRRQGAGLQAEIAFREALSRSRQKLAEPLHEPAAQRRSRREPGLERVGPARARARELGQDLGLDL